jgi:excinuclease ABC subunit C
LDEIKGIGPKTRDLLIDKLKSVKRIKETDIQTLTDIIGASKATIVHNYFAANE